MRKRGPLIPQSWLADALWPHHIRESALVAPAEGICDEPCVCLRVNVRWAAFVGGALHILEQPEVWAGTEADKEAAIQQVRELLDNMGCQCSGSCTCQVYVNIMNAVGVLINLELTQMDDGTIPSWAPDAPDITFSEDSSDTSPELIALREAALCYAVKQYIAGIILGIAERTQTFDEWNEVIAGILIIIDPPVGYVFEIVTQALVVFMTLLLADVQAINRVACCMYDNLLGQDITFDNFKNALGSCGFGFGANDAQLASIINRHNQKDQNYRILVRYLGYARDSLPDGFEADECECETCWEADLKCGQTRCYEVIEGIWDCTSFDGWWENEKIASEEAIEITIRFPSTYIRRVLINTDAFLGQTNKILKVYKGGDSSTGELVDAIAFDENFPVTREVIIASDTDQITWRMEVETVGGFTFSLRRPVICSRELAFPLGECEP